MLHVLVICLLPSWSIFLLNLPPRAPDSGDGDGEAPACYISAGYRQQYSKTSLGARAFQLTQWKYRLWYRLAEQERR